MKNKKTSNKGTSKKRKSSKIDSRKLIAIFIGLAMIFSMIPFFLSL